MAGSSAACKGGESQSPVLAIVGPTASGKTAAALALANHLDIEIINVDSGQVYRQMDIGTAKPSAEERQRIPHWLIDIRDPKDAYSAAAFCADTKAAVIDIRSRGRIPLLVGGTMFYLNALENGLGSTLDIPAEVRQNLRRKLETDGSSAMHAQLRELDPRTAERLHVNDRQRILRALEVVTATGRVMPPRTRTDDCLHVQKLALVPSDRTNLHYAIGQRYSTMLQSGFLDEVRGLMKRGDLSLEHPSMRSIGYRQVWEHLSRGTTEREMIDKAVAATRQLAKRQLTWLRGLRGVVWFQSDSKYLESAILQYVVAYQRGG